MKGRPKLLMRRSDGIPKAVEVEHSEGSKYCALKNTGLDCALGEYISDQMG